MFFFSYLIQDHTYFSPFHFHFSGRSDILYFVPLPDLQVAMVYCDLFHHAILHTNNCLQFHLLTAGFSVVLCFASLPNLRHINCSQIHFHSSGSYNIRYFVPSSYLNQDIYLLLPYSLKLIDNIQIFNYEQVMNMNFQISTWFLTLFFPVTFSCRLFCYTCYT